MHSNKRYDRTYFDHWYRDPVNRIGSRADLTRKVAAVVAITEHVLGRPLRSVLDIGCGEARWQPVLQGLRPGSRYAGVDSSRYAVARYGRRRNIRLGRFDALDEVGLDDVYDLVVCADVLHYLSTAELRQGLPGLASRVGGVAFLETYTAADSIVGDRAGFHRRSPAVYRRLLAGAGLVPCGLHCYLPLGEAAELAALERPVAAIGGRVGGNHRRPMRRSGPR